MSRKSNGTCTEIGIQKKYLLADCSQVGNRSTDDDAHGAWLPFRAGIFVQHPCRVDVPQYTIRHSWELGNGCFLRQQLGVEFALKRYQFAASLLRSAASLLCGQRKQYRSSLQNRVAVFQDASPPLAAQVYKFPGLHANSANR